MTAPHVQVLLATRNGAAHLGAQLASFEAQTHGDWSLWASDDGSQDGTVAILRDFAARHPGRVHLVEGPRAGSAANFLSLLGRPERPEGWVAFSDQDDVWMPDRLERAVRVLAGGVDSGGAEGRPGVYASRTILVDGALRPIRTSVLHRRGPSFGNALVQNILAGNTLVLNAEAARLLRGTAGAALRAGVRHHDWWVYLVAAGAGARIVNDPEPGLLYRQHGANAMGAHRGAGAGLARLRVLRAGVFRDWIGRNLEGLDEVRGDLAPEARALLDRFAAARDGSGGLARVGAVAGLGVRRQSRGQDGLLALMAALGWI